MAAKNENEDGGKMNTGIASIKGTLGTPHCFGVLHT
jgi:hypothetical protein